MAGEFTAHLTMNLDGSRPEIWLWYPAAGIATGLGPGAVSIVPIWAAIDWRGIPEADASGAGQRPEEI
ncbi:hypothetical protein PgNI_11447 [Pyricularia grisea]|uniref:Uncharacterized protein n=1 Tax=Pyricularia grisea TaxID=148305 RepID=A0A6P8APM2_PYRGI|nr:hypothetical protein PgNI_11447 [Pyricularia grisea]TLD03994.1 hypothetical protein PgNI_11447 [Pyricularia grisea]